MSYTCIRLNEESKQHLLRTLSGHVPADWEIIAHHMTICLGSPKEEHIPHLGKECRVIADALGWKDGRVCAIRVFRSLTVDGVPLVSANKTPHVTVAVNRKKGAKPKESNDIEQWHDMDRHLMLYGLLSEVTD